MASDFTGNEYTSDIASKLMLILSYDRNLEKRCSVNKITIGIIYTKNETGEALNDFSEKLADKQRQALVGKAVDIKMFRFKNALDAKKRLSSAGLCALFVTKDLKRAVSTIAQITRSSKIPTFTISKGYAEQGLAIAILQGSQRVDIIINLKAAKSEGMDLHSSLLLVAKLVD